MDAQATKLLEKVNAHCVAGRGHYLRRIEASSEILLHWVAYLKASHAHNSTIRILDAVGASMVEAGGYLTLGLVRPAIFSIRTQYELMLAWIYFYEHPVEWRKCDKFPEEFPMRAFLIKYLKENGDGFQRRMAILLAKKSRSLDDPYSILSAHVHSTSTFCMPAYGELSSVVSSPNECEECCRLQADVAEFLSDTLAAWHAERVHDIPANIRAYLSARLGDAKSKEFFS